MKSNFSMSDRYLRRLLPMHSWHSDPAQKKSAATLSLPLCGLLFPVVRAPPVGAVAVAAAAVVVVIADELDGTAAREPAAHAQRGVRRRLGRGQQLVAVQPVPGRGRGESTRKHIKLRAERSEERTCAVCSN